MAGLPCRIQFDKSQKVFSEFRWNDRLHHEKLGGFLLRNDKQAKVSVVSDGPLCTVVRVEAAYKREDGTQPPSQPRAVYDWYYFHDSPVAYVTATITQQSSYRWNEVHFLELIFPGRDFMNWAGAGPAGGGELVADGRSHRNADWAALLDDKNAIGMFGCGSVLVHDGRGQYGTYLHAEGDRSWQPWDDTLRRYSGWLWIGTAEDPPLAIQSWQQRLPIELPATLTTRGVHEAIETGSAKADAAYGVGSRDAVLERRRGNSTWKPPDDLNQCLALCKGRCPATGTCWRLVSYDWRLSVVTVACNWRVLFDAGTNHEHLAASPLPLFRLTLRNAETKELERVTADRGWQQVSVEDTTPGTLLLRWQHPENVAFGALTVTAQAQADPASNAVRWQLNVAGQSEPWSLWHVVFPQVAVSAPGEDPVLLIPRGPGEEQRGVWQRAFSFRGMYPSGWTSMQFMAAYDRPSHRGFYWAIHDPMGGTKELSAKSLQPSPTLVLAADTPVPDMGKPGNSFQLNGEAVWQVFSGDWYDAAVIYRDWVATACTLVPTTRQ